MHSDVSQRLLLEHSTKTLITILVCLAYLSQAHLEKKSLWQDKLKHLLNLSILQKKCTGTCYSKFAIQKTSFDSKMKHLEFAMQVSKINVGRIKFGDTQLILPPSKLSSMPAIQHCT